MWELLFFISVCVLFFNYLKLSARVDKLEQRTRQSTVNPDETERSTHSVQSAKAEFTTASTLDTLLRPIPRADDFQPAEEKMSIPAPQVTPAEPFAIVEWFREQTLIKVGAVIFFIGSLWFLGYAFEQNWISPLFRVFLGLLVGVVAYVGGFWRQPYDRTQYQTLTVLGSAIWFGSVAASQFVFTVPLLPPIIALTLLVMAVGYTVYVALSTGTEWLAVVAALAGLIAPWFVNSLSVDATGLLLYLFVLSLSLLAVVFLTHWRYVLLTLLVGVTMQHIVVLERGAIELSTLWWFVLAFSVLFFAASVLTLLRTLKLEPIDITTFGILAVQFWFFTDQLSEFPAAVLFAGAALMAFVGYLARLRGGTAALVSLFAAVSAAGVFVATSYLFAGYSLTIAYALEALLVTYLATKVATAPRSVVFAAATFALPLFTGLVDLTNSAWENGIMHAEAFGSVCVIGSLGVAVMYLTHKALLAPPLAWLQQLAGTLAITWYGFTIATMLVVAEALKSVGHSAESIFLLLTLSVLAVVVLLVYSHVSFETWRRLSLFTVVAPGITGLTLLLTSGNSLSTWEAFVTSAFILVTVSLSAYIGLQARIRSSSFDAVSAYSLLWIILGYSAFWIFQFWHSFLPAGLSMMATYVSYALVLYAVSNVLIQFTVRFAWVLPVVAAFSVPGLMSLTSISLAGWPGGVFSPDALGLYVFTTILLLLATTLLGHRVDSAEVSPQRVSQWLYGISAGYAVATVWMVTHTIATSPALAVTSALLMYTVAGLGAYLYGRSQANTVWRRAGIVLLVGVVARLGLVDVWGMDPLWRIVTFLGIGALFIIAALLERPLKPSSDERDDISVR